MVLGVHGVSEGSSKGWEGYEGSRICRRDHLGWVANLWEDCGKFEGVLGDVRNGREGLHGAMALDKGQEGYEEVEGLYGVSKRMEGPGGLQDGLQEGLRVERGQEG